MIDINVKWEGKGAVLRQLDAIKSGIERTKVLAKIAASAVDLIKTRTLAGKDENDGRLIPSRRAQRDGGQTLSDKGHMLGAMKVLSVTSDKAVIGFGASFEAKKAWWAQAGTKPHWIGPAAARALAWKPGGGRAKGGIWWFSRGHMHPGTPPRPFFGISPNDARELQAECNRLLAEALDRGARA
jgi:phage gpG-like protein